MSEDYKFVKINGVPIHIKNFLVLARQIDRESVWRPGRLVIPHHPLEPVVIKAHALELDGFHTDTDITNLCLIALKPLYDQDLANSDDPPYECFIGSLITILAAVMPIENIHNSGLNGFLEQELIKCDIVYHKSPEALNIYVDEFRADLIEKMGLSRIDNINGAVQSVALTTLLFIAKKLGPKSITPWFHKHCKGIIARMYRRFQVKTIVSPPLKNCVGYYTVISYKHDVRKCVFELYRKYAGDGDGKYVQVFKMLIKQLMYTKLSYWPLICSHMFDPNSKVIFLTELLEEGFLKVIREAHNYLRNVNPEDRAFVKILHRPEDCMCLKTYRFRKFLIVARIIAKMGDESLQSLKTSGPE